MHKMGTVTYYAMVGNVKQQEGTNLQLLKAHLKTVNVLHNSKKIELKGF